MVILEQLKPRRRLAAISGWGMVVIAFGLGVAFWSWIVGIAFGLW